MVSFSRRDRLADPSENANTVLKPAVYEPPGSAASGGSARPNPLPPADAPRPASTVAAPAPSGATTRPASGDAPESKLFVGVNIKLKGVEISDCDALVIEGQVEATVHSKQMEIAKPGTLKGNAQIDVAEIHGEFVGDLTARTRLVVHSTGRVTGTIRYGKLVIAEGGEITGDIKRLESGDTVTASAAATGVAASTGRQTLSPSAERWSN